jgi:GH24 family phage-related lysozyme (muramidase)
VALALADRAHQCYPTNPARGTKAVLQDDGTFSQLLTGPIPLGPAVGESWASAVFGVLSLVSTWESEAKQNPISGFLGFDDQTFALFDPNSGPSWNAKCAWISSQEWSGIAPRPAKPKKGQEAIPAPGPEAGGLQSSALTLEEMFADFIPWEGDVPHLYLDSEGYVTIGIGTCLVARDKPKDPTRALALPLKNLATDEPADQPTIREAFTKVASMPRGKNSEDYLTHPLLTITEEEARRLLREEVETKVLPALAREFPKFRDFPKCARRALVDILYNCGAAYLSRGEPPHHGPKLRAAVLAEDWARAAKEVPERGRVSRRQWRQDLFNYAQDLKTQGSPT